MNIGADANAAAAAAEAYLQQLDPAPD